jgi:hypothetical protein
MNLLLLVRVKVHLYVIQAFFTVFLYFPAFTLTAGNTFLNVEIFPPEGKDSYRRG